MDLQTLGKSEFLLIDRLLFKFFNAGPLPGFSDNGGSVKIHHAYTHDILLWSRQWCSPG